MQRDGEANKKYESPLSEKPLQEFRAHKNKSFQGSSLIKLNDPRAHLSLSFVLKDGQEFWSTTAIKCVMQSERADRDSCIKVFRLLDTRN